MLRCNKCGKWFHIDFMMISVVPEHDCKWGGPTNPYRDRIKELEEEVKELKEKLKVE